MKTIDLKRGKPSIDQILAMAKSDSVLIEGIDGNRYVLEEADEFEREVATLGESRKFMKFLEARSKETGRKSIETEGSAQWTSPKCHVISQTAT